MGIREKAQAYQESIGILWESRGIHKNIKGSIRIHRHPQEHLQEFIGTRRKTQEYIGIHRIPMGTRRNTQEYIGIHMKSQEYRGILLEPRGKHKNRNTQESLMESDGFFCKNYFQESVGIHEAFYRNLRKTWENIGILRNPQECIGINTHHITQGCIGIHRNTWEYIGIHTNLIGIKGNPQECIEM